MAEETSYAALEEGSPESRRDMVAVCSKARASLDQSQSMIARIWGMSLINFALSHEFHGGPVLRQLRGLTGSKWTTYLTCKYGRPWRLPVDGSPQSERAIRAS